MKNTIEQKHIVIIAGKKRSGKTERCHKHMRKHIDHRTAKKENYRILVVTDIPNAYDEFKPLTNASQIKIFQNEVMLINLADFNWDVSLYEDLVLIIDCGYAGKIYRFLEGISIINRTKNIDLIYTTQRLLDDNLTPKFLLNSTAVQLFDTIDDHEKTANRYANIFHDNYLIPLAIYSTHFNKYRPYFYCNIDLQNKKVYTDERSFYMAAQYITLEVDHPMSIAGLHQEAKLLNHLTKYFGE